MDGLPVEVVNADGKNAIVLVCEHAANRIPVSMNRLGLSGPALESHIAWDSGAAEVARHMSCRLDAPLIMARFSRLVFDCNRSPESGSAILGHSDGYAVPGNSQLTESDRAARVREVYEPFRNQTGKILTSRRDQGIDPVLVTIHSFTPIYAGKRRDLDLGVLHDRDARLADKILEIAEKDLDLTVKRNAPYGPEDGVTHTLATHAVPRGLLNVMLEIRNDLIGDPTGRQALAERLSRYVIEALAALPNTMDDRIRAGSAG